MPIISDLNQFLPATKVLASEVNDNFEKLRQGHNDVETRVSDMEDQPEMFPIAGGTLQGSIKTAAPVDITTDSSVLTLTDEANSFAVCGTDDITSIEGWDSGVAIIRWNSSRKIIHDSNILVLQGAVNRATAQGDVGIYEFDGAVVRELAYFPNTRKNVFGTVRQTVLSGKKLDTGDAAFLTVGTGLGVNILGAVEPVVITFADGYDSYGAVDCISVLNVDVNNAWSNLVASSVNYLFVERAADSGELVYSSTTIAPVYGVTKPSSPVFGQHFFNVQEMRMYYYNGSTWEIKHRVFLGEAVTNTSSVASVVSYALNGKYVSADTALTTAGVKTIFSTNIGSSYLKPVGLFIRCVVAEGGFSVGDVVVPFTNPTTGANGTPFTPCIDSRNAVSVTVGLFNGAGCQFYLVNKSTGGIFQCTQANWKQFIICERNF